MTDRSSNNPQLVRPKDGIDTRDAPIVAQLLRLSHFDFSSQLSYADTLTKASHVANAVKIEKGLRHFSMIPHPSPPAHAIGDATRQALQQPQSKSWMMIGCTRYRTWAHQASDPALEGRAAFDPAFANLQPITRRYILRTGCLITVLSFSGMVRRTSLR